MPNPAPPGCGTDTHITLSPVTSAPEIARAFVRHRLRSLGAPEETVIDGCVIASELTTNVVRHVPHAKNFRLYIGKNGHSPLIKVWDPSPARPVIKDDPEGESGRGLVIVAALSTTWYDYIVPPEQGGGKIVAALL